MGFAEVWFHKNIMFLCYLNAYFYDNHRKSWKNTKYAILGGDPPLPPNSGKTAVFLPLFAHFEDCRGSIGLFARIGPQGTFLYKNDGFSIENMSKTHKNMIKGVKTIIWPLFASKNDVIRSQTHEKGRFRGVPGRFWPRFFDFALELVYRVKKRRFYHFFFGFFRIFQKTCFYLHT